MQHHDHVTKKPIPLDERHWLDVSYFVLIEVVDHFTADEQRAIGNFICLASRYIPGAVEALEKNSIEDITYK